MRNKKRKGRLDFLPNRQNKYSIRRFTVGTASILIGATLIFGANSDAKAAEDTEANSSHSVGNNDKGEGSVKESTEAEAVSNPETTDTTSHDTQATETEASQASDETSSTEQSVQDDQTQEEATDVQAEQPSQHETKASNDDTSSSQVDPSTQQKEDQYTEETSNETDQVQTEEAAQSVESNKEITQSSNNKVETQDTHADINKVEDRTSAVDYYAKTTGVSSEEAEQAIDALNIDTTKASAKEIKQAVLFEALKKYSDEQNQNPVAVRGYAGFRAADEVVVDAPIHLNVTDAESHNPGYESTTTKPGVSVDLDQTGDNDMPEGSEYEFAKNGLPSGWTGTIDQETGTITVTPPLNAQQNKSYPIKVIVTYPDGSKSRTLSPRVKVLFDDSRTYHPGYEEKTTTPAVSVTVPQTKDTNVPEGTRYTIKELPSTWTATVDEHTGELVVTPPASANPGDYADIILRVFYPDNSTNETSARVHVIANDTLSHDPGYNEVFTYPGKTVKSSQVNDTNMPEGSVYSIAPGYEMPEGWTIDLDSHTGEITATAPEIINPNTSIGVTVLVTYPDGTTDSPNARITVLANDAQKYNPGYEDSFTNPGVAVSVDQTKDKDIPEGTRYEIDEPNLVAGWTATVDPTTGRITATPSLDSNENSYIFVPVNVIYPDGTIDNVRARVTVKLTDAEKHYPGYAPKTTKPGQSVDVPQVADKAIPSGTQFEVSGNVPEGWTIEINSSTGTVTATPPANANPGDVARVPVTVKYPDGSTDTANAQITVIATDAQTNEPGYDPKTTKPGQPVEVPQTKDPDLPTGTQFEGPKDIPDGWTVDVDPNTGKVTVTPPADVDPNTSVDIPVTVKYPDGSTDTTNAKVTVTPNDAQDNDPGYDDKSTKPGQPVDVPQTKDKDLPPGTQFEGPKNVPDGWTVNVDPNTGTVTVTPPKDAKPGTKVGIPVTVKVPDGTTLKPGDTITVVEKDKHGHASTPTKVTVGDTENTAHQPIVDPIHGGGTSVSGKGTPGNTVEVTLPDGSKVTGEVDKDGNFTIKVPDGKELKPGDKVTVVEKDKNGHTSPATEVTVGDYPNTAHQPTVDPIHSGDKTVTGKGTPGNTVEVTLPDGSTVTGTVDKDGNFTIKVPDGTTLKPGDTITVVEKDKYGHTSTPTVVTVTDKEMNGNNCDMPKKDDNGQAPMDNHGSDMNTGDMTEHASTPAMTQGSDMAQGHDDSMKHAEAKDDAKSEAKALPETGNTDNSGTIFGSLFAALGALFLAGRRRKKEDK